MKPTMKKVKHFNSTKYNEQFAAAFSNRIEAKELNKALKSFPDCEGMEQIEKLLNKKTGFVNVQMSASAMGLENEYKSVTDYLGVIDLKNYKENFTKLTNEFVDGLREENTIYWSEADAKIIDKVNKNLKTINDMDIRAGFGFNNLNQLVFNEKQWNVWQQLNG
jgi:hypothetical protein